MQLFESVSKWLSEIKVVRRIRSGPRVTVKQQVLARTGDSSETYPVLLCDLSSGGARIRTDSPLSIGDTLWLRIDDDTDKPFDIAASVIGMHRHESGLFSDYRIRLTRMKFADARALSAFIDRRLRTTPIGSATTNGNGSANGHATANGRSNETVPHG